MTAKPDKQLMYYAFSAAFLLCTAITASATVFFGGFMKMFLGIAGAALFILLLIYLIMVWSFTDYKLYSNVLEIKSGVIFRRTTFLYIDRITALYKMKLPFKCGFCIIKVAGGSALVLTDSLNFDK